MKLFEVLEETLKEDKRFISENDKLIKAAVSSKAMSMDSELISLLLGNEELKKTFFTEVDGIMAFDKVKFNWVVNNKEFLPDSYTRFKNKIGLSTNGRNLSAEYDETVLVWPYKDTILEGGQTREDQERDEVFYNETLSSERVRRLMSPKAFSKAIRYSSEGEELVTEINDRDNLIIKGNNLLALSSLLEKYKESIKLIYIDPPYNTDSDGFNYNDSFNHSTWLTFMRNRLKLAKKFLLPDGVICVQINDNEAGYLKVLMDEIFGINAYQTTIYIRVRYAEKTLKQDSMYHKEIEQVLVYKKEGTAKIQPNLKETDYDFEKFKYSISVEKPFKELILGSKKVEIFDKDNYTIHEHEGNEDGLKEIWASGTVLDGNSSGRFFRDFIDGRVEEDGLGVVYRVWDIGDDKYEFRYFTGPKRARATKGKYYQGVPVEALNNPDYKNKKPIEGFIDMAGDFGNIRHEGNVNFGSGKKPEKLLEILISYFSNEGDRVMDFFLGSGTTTAVAHKMNRRYIGVEQMDYINEYVVKRMERVIAGDQTGISTAVDWENGGDFIYLELKMLNEEYILKLEKAEDTAAILSVYNEVKEKGFLIPTLESLPLEDIQKFKEFSLEEQRDIVLEALDKNKLYVNATDLDDEEIGLTKEEKKITNNFYRKDEEDDSTQSTLPL